MQLQLKAVFLGRFASYVQWPRQEASAFDITVLGAHPLGEQLAALYADKLIQGKPVHIRTVARIEDIGTPQVLFVALPTVAARQAAITYAQRHGILIVATLVIIVNFTVDILYGVANPSIRHQK